MAVTLELDGTQFDIRIVQRVPTLKLQIGDRICDVATLDRGAGGRFSIEVDGIALSGNRAVQDDKIFLHCDDRAYEVSVVGARRGGLEKAADRNEIRAEMPGIVVAANCRAGEAVQAGQTLLTVESMKLQVAVNAPRDGVIKTLHVEENGSFDKGAALITLRAEEKSPVEDAS